MNNPLPVGKLPAELLSKLIIQAPILDDRILLRPGIGIDCAVVELGETLLVFKTDPITFATEEIGWYLVQVNVNDIATTGAIPRWLLITALLPEKTTSEELVERISLQVYQACEELGISVIGGHTEITYGLDRPILVGALIGETRRGQLVTPQGAQPGDSILLTKGVPIEATAIMAREFGDKLGGTLEVDEIQRASRFLHEPGISVLRDARIALESGKVNAMHDPTEGGLATALWELAEASSLALQVDIYSAPVYPLSARICQAFGLDPYSAIASGSLLLTCPLAEVPGIRKALEGANVPCTLIGHLETGPVAVWQETKSGRVLLPRPARDEIARLFEGE